MRPLVLPAALAALVLASPPAAPGQSVDPDPAALAETRRLLGDPAAREAWAARSPQAAEADALASGFPPWAREEIDEIVMLILQESGEGASRHTDAYQRGGAAAAMGSFSPAVRARIAALEERLAADPEFNTPENMARMQALFPGFLAPASR